MILKKVTIADVLSWDPCSGYAEAKLKELFAGRESLDALEILDVDISVSDRLWAVYREEVLPAPILHEVACRYAEQAIRAIEAINLKPDPRSLAAIEAKRKWLRGEITDIELSAARDAAWDAARDAAWDAARDAAWAAWDAAWDAARDAAWDAALEEQFQILKDLIQEELE